MRTDNHQPEQLAFCQRTALAVIRLKHRLQRKYEQAYPRLRDIIPAIIDQEEKNAWNFSLFPHLLLPDLVQGRIEKLDFERPKTNRTRAVLAIRFSGSAQSKMPGIHVSDPERAF